MKISKSNLELLEFVILNSNYHFSEPSKEIDIRKNFSKYDIDLDFSKRDIKTENQEHLFHIFIKTTINHSEHPQPGYQIFAESLSIFRVNNPQQLDDNLLTNLKNISALSISINNLRNFIANMTAYGPFGKFILPAIDVNQLIKSKIKTQK